MSTPEQTQKDVEPRTPAAASDVIDPDFDDLDEANTEFCVWLWPDRKHNE